MRFLHTADWHIGKPLRGRSRMDEFAAALDEVHRIAATSQPNGPPAECATMIAGPILSSSMAPR